MLMVILSRTCHDCYRGNALLSIYLEVQELSSLTMMKKYGYCFKEEAVNITNHSYQLRHKLSSFRASKEQRRDLLPGDLL